MTDTELHDAVCVLIAQVLAVEPSRVPDLRRRVDEEWDSLAQIEVVFRLEEQFGVTFTDASLLRMSDLDSIVSALRQALAER